MENSSHGLTLLDPDHKVVVTGEEHYQPVLSAYAPRADGRARRVAVELGFAPADRGRTAIEVRLDGRRVGELTQLMTRRYGPLVDGLLRQGRRPGAVALVVHGRRGWVEMELRLPEVPAEVPADPAPPTPRPSRRRPRPGPDGGHPPRGRRSRKPYWVGAGVLALLIGVGAAVGGSGETPAPSAAPPAAPSVAPTVTPAPPVPETTATGPTADVDRTEPSAPGRGPSVTGTAVPERRADTREPEPQPVPQRAPEPERRPAPEPEPAPEPRPAPDPEPAPDPAPRPDPPAAVSYENCDAVRAAGADPIRTGDPGYSRQLDRDGDGIGCE